MESIIAHVTTGNVFEDLGFSAEEATGLALKTDLLLELERIIKRRRYNAVRAAKHFGVDKQVVTHIKNGDLNFFTVDLLIQMLERAGKQVSVVVSNKKRVRAA